MRSDTSPYTPHRAMCVRHVLARLHGNVPGMLRGQTVSHMFVRAWFSVGGSGARVALPRGLLSPRNRRGNGQSRLLVPHAACFACKCHAPNLNSCARFPHDLKLTVLPPGWHAARITSKRRCRTPPPCDGHPATALRFQGPNRCTATASGRASSIHMRPQSRLWGGWGGAREAQIMASSSKGKA